jgi:hypothetical protein
MVRQKWRSDCRLGLGCSRLMSCAPALHAEQRFSWRETCNLSLLLKTVRKLKHNPDRGMAMSSGGGAKTKAL